MVSVPRKYVRGQRRARRQSSRVGIGPQRPTAHHGDGDGEGGTHRSVGFRGDHAVYRRRVLGGHQRRVRVRRAAWLRVPVGCDEALQNPQSQTTRLPRKYCSDEGEPRVTSPRPSPGEQLLAAKRQRLRSCTHVTTRAWLRRAQKGAEASLVSIQPGFDGICETTVRSTGFPTITPRLLTVALR